MTASFDHPERLNEDGTVTLRMTPSAWHRYNLSPDTYQSFNGDSWVESELSYMNDEASLSERFGSAYADLDRYPIDLHYDHFTWEYDHAEIVRALAEELADWMAETLHDIGLESVSVKVIDSWSPAYYNFTSDGFEVEVTCDPAELRALTPDFDVDEWGAKHYRSRDGFMSFVTSRLDEDDWHAEYDGGFRVESLFAEHDGEDGWVMRLAEAEWEVYSSNVKVEPDVDAIRESILEVHGYMESGFTLDELRDWSAEYAAQIEGQMSLA